MFRRTLIALLAGLASASLLPAAEPAEPFVLVVMDPLSKELACDCVQGYAQRDYEKLAKFLEAELGRSVQLEYGESLAVTMQKKTNQRADLVIGKESVIRHEAKKLNLEMKPTASLTGKDGKTTMTGLIVVAQADPAITAADLNEHRILFGFADADEKYSAAIELFKALGVTPPEKPETCASCSVGATKLLELAKAGEKSAAVISSYAQPLLEGCGTIEKGDLRVVGETEAVPFVVAFVNDANPTAEQAKVQAALLKVGQNPELCKAIESKKGFVSFESKKN